MCLFCVCVPLLMTIKCFKTTQLPRHTLSPPSEHRPHHFSPMFVFLHGNGFKLHFDWSPLVTAGPSLLCSDWPAGKHHQRFCAGFHKLINKTRRLMLWYHLLAVWGLILVKTWICGTATLGRSLGTELNQLTSKPLTVYTLKSSQCLCVFCAGLYSREVGNANSHGHNGELGRPFQSHILVNQQHVVVVT